MKTITLLAALLVATLGLSAPAAAHNHGQGYNQGYSKYGGPNYNREYGKKHGFKYRRHGYRRDFRRFPGYGYRNYGYGPRFYFKYRSRDYYGHRPRRHSYAPPAYGHSGYQRPMLTAEVVARRLIRGHGLHVARLVYADGHYKVRARDSYGRSLKLRVNPYSGVIVAKYYAN